MRKKLEIAGVAIKTDEGDVFHLNKPNRHRDLIDYIVYVLNYTGNLGGRERQGFILNDGSFVDRIDSIPIARKSGQLKASMVSSVLTSEDLW